MENNRNHLLDILNLINNIQHNATCDNNDNTCSRPILGQNNILTYNTRPISFYLCNGNLLEIEYVDGDETLTSSVFRIEDIDDKCITIRLLSLSDDSYISTNEFATVNAECIAAIRCYNDTNINL